VSVPVRHLRMRLIEDESQQNDIPWVNEYLGSQTGNEYDVSPIQSLKWTAKGILVLASNFKGFVFKGTQTHSHLTDAVPHWKSDPNLPFRLYAQALPSGKVAIAVEDTEQSVCIIDNTKSVSFKSEGGESGDTGVGSQNPFIVGLPVPTTSGKATGTTRPTTKAKTSP